MSILSPYDWECMDNHLPDWIDKYDVQLTYLMSQEDSDRAIQIMDEYNQLTTREENTEEEDGFTLYGVEAQKDELVKEFIAICDKYKTEAFKRKSQLKHLIK